MTGQPLVSAHETGRADGQRGNGLPTGADALSPVREALIGEAIQLAGELRAAATADADAVLADARRQAAEILSQARAQGESDGQSAAAARNAMSRRAARSVTLAAQRDAYDELRRRVRGAVSALREDPVYPRLLDRLEALAHTTAGPSAAVTRHPSGGVVAQGPGVFVDCSLPRLADRAVDALGAEVSELWSG